MNFIAALSGNATSIEPAAAAEDLSSILTENESVKKAYQILRDVIVFTNHRVIQIDKLGVTGTKRNIVSIPYRSIEWFSMENAGALDLDGSIKLGVRGHIASVEFHFHHSEHIPEAYQILSEAILEGGRGPQS